MLGMRIFERLLGFYDSKSNLVSFPTLFRPLLHELLFTPITRLSDFVPDLCRDQMQNSDLQDISNNDRLIYSTKRF